MSTIRGLIAIPAGGGFYSRMRMQVTICGGGNAAHTLAGLLAARQGLSVHVFAPYGGEARRWQEGIAAQGGITVQTPQGIIRGQPQRVSEQAEEVLPGSSLVLLALPAFAHQVVLKEIAPYLEQGIWVGALPARGGFDWCAREALGGKFGHLVVFGLQTLPWACRIQSFGRAVTVLGTKAQVDLAACPPSQAPQVAARLGELLAIELSPVESFLGLTLSDTGQLIHPGIMYGLFGGWDGAPFAEAPLFYQGVDEATAGMLERLSGEVQSVRAALHAACPELDFSAVRELDEWLLRSYPRDIADRSSLRACFNTNRSYAGLRAPMREVDGGLAPDFTSRYLCEDLPYNLLATRGLAELAGVPTPMMDEVIRWAQERMGKSYLIAGGLQGRDLADSRAPQRYGYHELNQLVDLKVR